MRFWMLFAAIALFPLPTPAQEAKPILRLDDRGHTAEVCKLLYTGKGRMISVSKDGTVRFWDPKGEQVQVLRLPTGNFRFGELYTGALSPDKKTLAVAGWASTDKKQKLGAAHIYLISLETEKITQVFRDHLGSVFALAFSPDGTRLAAAGAGSHAIHLFDLTTNRLVDKLVGHTERVLELTYDPRNSDRLMSAATDQLRMWTVSNKQATIFERKDFTIQRAALSPDGAYLAAAGQGQYVHLWKSSGQYVKAINAFRATNSYGGLAFSPNSDGLIYTAFDRWQTHINLVHIPSGKFVREIGSINNERDVLASGDIAFAVKGSSLAVADDANHAIYIWNLSKPNAEPRLVGDNKRKLTQIAWAWDKEYRGQLVLNLRKRLLPIEFPNTLTKDFFDRSFQFGPQNLGAPLGEFIPGAKHGFSKATLLKRRNATQIDVYVAGKLVKERVGVSGDPIIDDFALVGDKHAVLATERGLYLVEILTGTKVHLFYSATGPVRSLTLSPVTTAGRQYVAALWEDNVVRIYDPMNREPLLNLAIVGTQWICWTRQGYYAASAFGERLMGWQVNQGHKDFGKFYPASQFRAALYRPDVIRRVLEIGDVAKALANADFVRGGPSIKIDDLEEILPPKVKLVTPTDLKADLEGDTLVVSAEAESTGKYPVTALRLLVNGRPFAGKKGYREVVNPKLGSVQTTFKIKLEPGTYQIAVQASSAVSKTVSDAATVHLAENVATRGVRRIDLPEVKVELPSLHVLATGVSEYEGSLKLQFAHKDANVLAETLKGKSKLYKETYVDVMTDKKVTPEKFFAALKSLKEKMTARDVAIISFAGHGELDAKGNFYLLPVNVDPKEIAKTGISGERLREEIAQTPGRIILLLDACHSGGIKGGKALAAANASDELLRGMVSEECGVVVMCSSTGNEYSLESPKWGHGLFTLAVVEGLKGAADDDGDGFVDLKELDHYVYKRVRKESEKRQTPVTEIPLTITPFNLR